jgi:hypothetical protein
MNWGRVSLTIVTLSAIGAASVTAQQKLGDLVAEGGYDWVIGRWVATTDEGQKVEFTYDWGLDKHVVLATSEMGRFRHYGMIMLSPSNGEVSDIGIDNMGGTWKGTWSEGYDGLIHRVEHTSMDGDVHQGEIVHERVNADSMAVAFYGLNADGARSSEPWAKLTYKRRPAGAASLSTAAESTERSRDYQILGDLISEGGYEWLVGKWVATKDERTYELEHKPILDKHAAQVDVKIGDFQYEGIVMYVPARQEILQIGADNMGGTWKGTWEEDYEGAVHKVAVTRADGTTQKMQLVYIKGDNDTLKTKEYPVDTSGERASTPRDELTFKRQKPPAQGK